jgi:secreted trypsin-like serine protease
LFTTAHCVYGESEIALSLVGGVTDLTSNSKTELKISSMIIHEGYVEGERGNDIAILVLTKPVSEDSSIIKPIELMPQVTDMPPNTEVILLGWGSLNIDGGITDKLRKTTVTTLDPEECTDIYGERIDVEQFFCAKGTNEAGEPTDSCVGDTGGPVIFLSPQPSGESIQQLGGIISYGFGKLQSSFTSGVLITMSIQS